VTNLSESPDLDIILISDSTPRSLSPIFTNFLHWYPGEKRIYVPIHAFGAEELLFVANNIYMEESSQTRTNDELYCSHQISVMKKQLDDRNPNINECVHLLNCTEAKMLYNDNIKQAVKYLKPKYADKIIENIIGELMSGKHHHTKIFNANDLTNLGLNVEIGLPENISNIAYYFLQLWFQSSGEQ